MIIDTSNTRDIEAVKKAYAGLRLGITSGSFDMFHTLHLVTLQRCRRLCDVLAVGVDSDDLVRKRKGLKRPLVPEHNRVAIVGALSCVDIAFVLGSVTEFGKMVELLGASVIFKNDSFTPDQVLGNESAEVVIIPDLVAVNSTTEIIEEVIRRHTSDPIQDSDTSS